MVLAVNLKMENARARSVAITPEAWASHLRTVKGHGLSFDALAEAWMADAKRKGRRPGTLAMYEASRRLKMLPAFGHLAPPELTPQIVEAWWLAQAEAGYSGATISRELVTLSALCRFAVRIGAMPTNPVRQLDHRPRSKPRDPGRRSAEVLSVDEVRRVVRANLPIERKILYATILLTGMRIAEVTGARWCDLRFDRGPLGELVIRREWCCKAQQELRPKTNTDRRLPIHPVLADLLQEQRRSLRARLDRPVADDDLIIPHPEMVEIHYSERSALRWFRKDMAKLGFAEPVAGPRTLHGLRHTFCSALIASGVPRETARWFTHEGDERSVFDRYVHTNWPVLCAAISKLEV